MNGRHLAGAALIALAIASLAVSVRASDGPGTIWIGNWPATQNVNCVSGCGTGGGGGGDVTVTNFPATQPVSFTMPALVAGNANIGDVDVASLPAITGTVSVSNFPGTQPVSGTVTVNALPAGNNNIGDVDIASGTVSVGNFPSTQNVNCTSGCSSPAALLTHNAVLAASTNATVVKGSAGSLQTIVVSNNSATIAYLKIYDKATAPTCGTDVPVLRFQIPATAAGPFSIVLDGGRAFTNGIGYCAVTGIADNSTTAVAASAYIVTLGYR